MTLEHENDVQEWFINNEEGIEHGYNLYKRLEGDGRLLLTINVVKGEVIQNRDNIIIKLNDGRKIDYKKLVVLDNKKKILPASLIRTSAHQIQIGFDDSQAVYPIIVDPILSYTPDTILQYDLRVSNVSSAGDVNGDGYEDVIVSIRNADKTVFVYHGSANGIGSTFNTKLMGSGISVSGAGDVNGDGYDDVIVGNPYYSNSTGAARVYYGSPNGIDSTFSTLIEDHTHQGFGASVASAGDVNDDGYDDVIVGAPDYNGVTWFYGAAFVYHGSSSGVSTTVSTELIHICEATENHCTVGLSVSSAGDVNGDGYDDVIIGGHSSFYHTSQTYIHLGSANGVDSSFSTKLLGSGASVSSAGDVNGDGYDDIIVGAPAYDNLTGAAFVYHGSSNGINSTFSTRTQIEDAQQYLQLGSSVSSAGDVDGDGYDDVIVGASKFNGSATSTGAAFIHYGSANGISSTFSIQFGSTQEWAELGASVSGAGDINGDGYDDVIVSVPGELAAYIYQGYVDSDHDGVGDDSDTPPNDGSAIVDTDEAAPTPSSGGGSTGFRILLLALLMCGNRRRKPLD
ncbi:FG-GAP-like repeat-containing protein [Aliikangiella coralliicola]|uniref:FG-GAP-like repeat-containing protein n=1 Tax=Aliikangiella coralliicola TaxID=2592383 RepID=UPI00143CD5C5|nr:FG-GAP-like repeat-containing protein [Aliikangiella coralliicola]